VNVVHVINSEQIGGAERFLVHLWRVSRDRESPRHALWVLRRGRDMRHELLDEAAACDVPVRIVDVRGNLDPAAPWRLRRMLEEVRPDAVHTHLVLAGFVGRWAAIRARVPCVVSSEQNVYEAKARLPWRLWERYLAERTTRVVACSGAVRDHLVERVGVAAGKVVVVPNVVDPADYEAESVADPPALRRAPDEFVVGTVGRLHPQKGHDILLRAFASLVRDRPRTRLAIVGEGPSRAALRGLAASLGVASSVTFVPWQREIGSVYRQMDLFTFPSRYEGFGIALLEAMWFGLPAVASRTGGIPEFAVDGETALLVPPGDVAALTGALNGLVGDDARCAALGRAGRVRASRFTIERLEREIPRIYGPGDGRSS
jgi:glycosyltransferase involved in cell wall biosynthesis